MFHCTYVLITLKILYPLLYNSYNFTFGTISDRLDITNINNSPRGTRFILPDPGPEVNGREYWDTDLYYAYEYHLERSDNRGVLFGKKRADYHRWLNNPSGPYKGETKEERQFDRNTRIQTLGYFELQDN